MNVENAQAQMRKGVLEYCILTILMNGEAYPSEIIEELKKAQLNILEGTLYPLLTRLKNANLLEYRWKESLLGPPRKYYSITNNGITFYHQLHDTWISLQQSVHIITNHSNKQSN